jgi:hypothetical protein
MAPGTFTSSSFAEHHARAPQPGCVAAVVVNETSSVSDGCMAIVPTRSQRPVLYRLGVLTACSLSIGATVLACTTGDRLPASPTAPRTSVASERSSAPPCTGADGRATLTALLDELSRGKHVDVGKYFVAPIQFVRWVDPSAYITFLPADDGSVTLDALQAHLDALVEGGISATLTEFRDGGYGGSELNNDLGGYFAFTVRGRASAHAPMAHGSGKGVVDCTTKKIKVFVIDGW